ncbi:MAG: carboxymuconolactone decarboxylase family protein [Pseudoxanthomonas sp.]
MPRIPLVEPEHLTPEQFAYYEGNPGGKLNIYRLLCQAPTCQPGYGALAGAIFAKLDVPPQERELVVLAVAQLSECAYEWAQHAQIARDMGIAQARIDAIAAGHYHDAIFNDRERALFEFTRQTVQKVRVDDDAFNAVAEFYEPRQIVELLFTIGAYMMLARIMEVAQLEVDAVEGAAVVRHAVARVDAPSL